MYATYITHITVYDMCIFILIYTYDIFIEAYCVHEKEKATHSNILVWRISWTEQSGRLQSMELQRQT